MYLRKAAHQLKELFAIMITLDKCSRRKSDKSSLNGLNTTVYGIKGTRLRSHQGMSSETMMTVSIFNRIIDEARKYCNNFRLIGYTARSV